MMLIGNFALTGIVRISIPERAINGHVACARKRTPTEQQLKNIFERILRMIQTKTHLSALKMDAVRDFDERQGAKNMKRSVNLM